MSHSRNCPFCQSTMTKADYYTEVDHYFCKETYCMNDDMPRYQINYIKDSSPEQSNMISCSFMIDDNYIQVDYENKRTTLSKLFACILMNTVYLNQSFYFDMTDLDEVSKNVRTLLLFF